jgi:FkbM family methyltransferase
VPSPASTNYLFFKKYINRKFDIIIDAGGFIGTFGLLMATRYPNSKIYIFEADPINYLKIKNNLELNGLKNVVIEPVGLWCKKEILKFNLSSSLNSSFLNNNIEDNLIKINVVSLNEYFNDIKNKIIFLKMNIEGAEIAAIQGALYFLQNNQVDLAVSTDHYVDGELTFSKIEELCTSLEMRVETVKDGFYVNTFATNISI